MRPLDIKIPHINKIIIIVTVLIACLSAFCLSAFREPVFDDISYLFIYDDNYLDNQSQLKCAQSISDVIDSQIWHYQHINGRAPVHVIVQLFDCLGGYYVFGFFNAITYIIFIFLSVKLILKKDTWKYPLIWLIIAIMVQYLYPYGLGCVIGPWYSIAMGINYLYTGALFLLFLNLFFGYSRKSISPLSSVLFCLVGFLAGWSNEAFAVPLSGGVLIYSIINRDILKNNSGRILLISLLIGTIFLVFAPGTFARVNAYSDVNSISNILASLFECYLKIKIFWILIVTILILKIFKDFSIRTFIKRNALLCWIGVFAILFTAYAHTMPHSLICIEVISMLLLLRAVKYHLIRLTQKSSKLVYSSIILLLIVYAIHISFVIEANIRRYDVYNNMFCAFEDSIDGIIAVDYDKENCLINPFVDNFDWQFVPYINYGIQYAVWHGIRDKSLTTLSYNDFNKVIENPREFFVDGNRMPGSAFMYDTGEKPYYYAPLDSLDLPSGYQVIASFEGDGFTKSLPWTRRLVYKLLGNKKAPKALDTFILKTRVGDYLVAEKILSTPSRIDIVPAE